ncbi:MAG: nicotinate (nicotinamide) nucleotide adenylyltransferase [Lachnospiraceae bacterium]|nr:nicotinate (nicotinamide) nucleotide adenylyltransferase [Candidatus Darwinimomas equi]
MKRIGLLGGTFDPPHNGHIILAENALKQMNLDTVILLVSPDPPHKQDKQITAFSHRYNMSGLAAEGKDGILVSDYETHLPVPSYTAQTLEHLKDQYPNDVFYFIIGEDSLDNIEKWYHPEKVMKLTELIVAVREENFESRTIEDQINYLKTKYGAVIHLLKSDYVNISSTGIRSNIINGKNIKGLVPEKVEEYIWKEKLYLN